jgi:hypothetical protein
MPSIRKAVFFLGLALTILPFTGPFKVADANVTAAGRANDFCHLSSIKLDGDLYCRPVRGIKYANVSTPGSYQRIVSMNADGSCSYSNRSYEGHLAPLSEEVRAHNTLHIFSTALFSGDERTHSACVLLLLTYLAPF